jgi:hypothetical protein
MKTIYKKIAICLTVAGLWSCSNDLDEKVYSSITQQSYNYTTNDFWQVIAAVYPPLRNVVNSVDSYFIPQEVTADAIVMTPNASGWDDGGKYRVMHYQTWNSEQSHIRVMWNWFYQGALFTNNIIEQLESDAIPAPSSADKQRGMAEVRAMRAFFYWQICDNFGDAPLVTARTSDLPEKTPRQEIFNFVVSELTAVIPDLSEEIGGSMYGRMNKWAAKALLANVYLNGQVYTGQAYWNECIIQCDDLINSGRLALSPNFTDPFRAHGVENNIEVIFTVPYDKLYAGGNNIHMWSWHTNSKKTFLTESAPWGDGAARGVSQFVETYDPDDERLSCSWLMGPQFEADGVTPVMCEYELRGQQVIYSKDLPDANYAHEGEGYRMFKYEVEAGTSDNSNTDVPLFRFSQVLMMKAECLLRLGQPGAGALVTQVRQRAFKNNPEKATVTDGQLKGNTVYNYGYVENYKIVDPGDQSPVQ